MIAKGLRRTALVIAALLLFAAAAVAWLVGTNSGATWAFHRADALLPERLAAESIEGTIAGALTVRGLHYGSQDSPVEVEARRIFIDLAFADLLTGTVHLAEATVEAPVVALRTAPGPEPAEQGSSSFDLRPPIDVVLDDLTVRGGAVRRAGTSLVDLRSLQLAGSWTDAGVTVDELDLDAAQGMAQLQGKLRHDEVYTGKASGAFEWRLPQTRVAGSLQADTVDGVLHASVSLSAPTSATLAIELAQREPMQWSFDLDLPRFDPNALLADSTLKSLAASLRGSGTQAGGSIRGRITIDGEPLVLRPLQFTLEGQRIGLDATVLLAGTGGELQATGDILLQPDPWRADLELQWDDVRLPAAWTGQRLATRGRLAVQGNTRAFSAEGSLALGPPARMAQVELALQGSPERIRLRQLTVQQPSGRLSVHGELQPDERRWDLEATASSFNPGAFLANWQGNLDFELATHGNLAQAGPRGELHLRNLQGSLRDRPVSGSADLTLVPGPVVAGHLRLVSGDSRIRLRGERGEAWDATARFDIDSLAAWVPGASGSASGRFSIRGEWPALQVSGEARASDVRIAGMRVDSARLHADIENAGAPAGSARLELGDAAAAGFTLESGTLAVSGDPQRHRIRLDATGAPVSAQLVARGSRTADGSWVETIRQLTIDPRDLESFTLDEPATVTVAPSSLEVSRTCLVNEQARLCGSGGTGQHGTLHAQYSVEELPLAMAGAFAPTLPVRLSGTVSGEGELRRNAAGKLFGELGLRSAQGAIAQPETAAAANRPLLTYRDLQLEARLEGSEARATVEARLQDSGSLEGRIAASGLGSATRPIDGALAARIPDLSALTLLTPQIADTAGRLRLQADIGGTLANPELQAELHAANLAADIPALGLSLENGELDLVPASGPGFAVSGSIQSGEGRLTFDGTASYGGELAIDIQGEQFLAADIPGAHVVADPDLHVEREAQEIRLTGQVRLPTAAIDLENLPRMVRAQTGSPDVVVVDEQAPRRARDEKVPLYADIDVILGEDVTLSGYGLKSELQGRLSVHEVPGQPTTASGEILVDGTYKAYGQDLTITEGSLLYAGTPLDDPALRIVAAREIDEDVTAGLRIAGTAQAPELSLFSDPAMGDANALSYLVAGRPLEDIGASDEDVDALQSAARSAGAAAGGLLSKPLEERLGIDTVSVQESEVLGGSAFTVGEYLSPRLYLSYGVGLFVPGDVITLRYSLSDELALRGMRGPEETRAGIEYQVEK